MSEWLDIVDEKGNPTGETVEREKAHAEGILHRTSHVWLMRKHRNAETGEWVTQVLLQKRSDTKDSFPGCYDISSAGHIPAGCGFEESALRELEEELGLVLSREQLISLGDLHKSDRDVFHGKPYHDEQISRVFYALCDREERDFQLQESEVSGVLWMDLLEVKKRLADRSFPNCIHAEELSMLPEILP